MKTEKPILFSAPMVRAILENRKTQTRRIVKAMIAPHVKAITGLRDYGPKIGFGFVGKVAGSDDLLFTPCPYPVGTRLWVREEHYRFGHWEPVPGVKTKAGRMKWRFVEDSAELLFDAPESFRKGRHHKDPATPAWHKRLARFMFRKHSRITLEVTRVRVERVQKVSEEDAKAEGCFFQSAGWDCCVLIDGWFRECEGHSTPRNAYRHLWESINGPDSWNANPCVWVYDFRRVEA